MSDKRPPRRSHSRSQSRKRIWVPVLDPSRIAETAVGTEQQHLAARRIQRSWRCKSTLRSDPKSRLHSLVADAKPYVAHQGAVTPASAAPKQRADANVVALVSVEPKQRAQRPPSRSGVLTHGPIGAPPRRLPSRGASTKRQSSSYQSWESAAVLPPRQPSRGASTKKSSWAQQNLESHAEPSRGALPNAAYLAHQSLESPAEPSCGALTKPAHLAHQNWNHPAETSQGTFTKGGHLVHESWESPAVVQPNASQMDLTRRWGRGDRSPQPGFGRKRQQGPGVSYYPNAGAGSSNADVATLEHPTNSREHMSQKDLSAAMRWQ